MDTRDKSVSELIKEDIIGKVGLFYEITSLSDGKKEEYLRLLKKLKDINKDTKANTKEKGDALEDVVNYIINNSFFLEVHENKRTKTHEIDQFITINDYGKQAMYEYKFSPELLEFSNGYFLGECKNYHEKVSSTWVGKFYTLLKVSGSCSLGIIFSFHGLKGDENGWNSAHGLTKIIYNLQPHNQKIYIIDFNINDFERIAKGENFFKIIKSKKKALALGTKSLNLAEPHENEDFIKSLVNEFNMYQ